MTRNEPAFGISASIREGSATTSTTPFTLAQIGSIAARYAPYLKFHPDERYLMCNVEWYLFNSTLYGPNVRIPHPTVADLPLGDDDGQWWLQMEDAVKPGNPATAKAYVHALWHEGQTYTDLQYWFLSGYNGPGTMHLSNLVDSDDVDLAPLGEHWADWEMVMVRVDNATQNPLGVFLSQHGSGEWIVDLSRFQRRNDQFVVYPSLNGHANYAQTGANPTEARDYELVSFYLRNDTADGGPTFDCSTCIEVVAADFIADFQAARWLGFKYRWGKGTKTNLSEQAVAEILATALAPYAWLSPFLAAIVAIVAPIYVKVHSLDDTNGIHGPETQTDYWTDALIPATQFSSGYTGITTNRGNPPAVVGFSGRYHAYYQDGDGNNGIMHAVSDDGKTWTRDNYVGWDTSSGLGAVVFRNKVHLFYRDPDGNGVLHLSSENGRDFGDYEYIGVTIDGAPNVAAKGDDRLCVLGVDHDGSGIMYAVWTQGSGWTHGYTGHATNRVVPPSVVAFDGKFCCYYQDGGGNNGIMRITSDDGITWSSPDYLGFTTSAGPCALTFQDQVQMFYRDPDGNGILHQDSADGVHFGNYRYTGLTCDFQPHASYLGNNVNLLAIDHDGNGIMWLNMYYW